jgi:hypothetical protein
VLDEGSRRSRVAPSESLLDEGRVFVPLPNFLVIGAPKAGTTSLYQYLCRHPQVFMSPVKEPSYFLPNAGESPVDPRPSGMFARTRDEYLELFEGVRGEVAIGEATPSYLHSEGAAVAIREAIPRAKLIAILRNPLERAYSGYSMRIAQGTETLTFAEAVASELDGVPTTDGRRRKYLQPGFYGRHLTRYRELFDAGQLRVYLFEELSTQPDVLWRDLCAFLDVEPVAASDRLFRLGPGRALVKRLVPTARRAHVKKRVKRWNSITPAFPPDVRRRLVELYREDIAQTERLIDRDLSAWVT